MSYSFGDKVKVTIFGQSHSEEIGVVIDGIEPGIRLDKEKITEFMKRRAPGRNSISTKRKEADIPEIVSGLIDGVTCGAPICAVIKNTDIRSGDYDNLKNTPRPGHADFTAHIKYSGENDIRGGGQFSGRMTAPMCFAGAVIMQILETKGIYIGARVASVKGICDEKIDSVLVSEEMLEGIKKKEFPVISKEMGEKMINEIKKASEKGDSVGGCVECFVLGMPAGVGGPLYEGLEGIISQSVFAVPAVKGIEFGAGFESAMMYGSENNDEFCVNDGKIKTKTNNHGGILGGISSSMPIRINVAIKPTPSISRPQQSVNLKTLSEEELIIKGRHDPCIVPRAVPAIEAAVAIAIINAMGAAG